MISHQPTIELDINRCFSCGRFWAVEKGFSATCPVCAARTCQEYREQLAAMERSVRAYKSNLTRAKRK